MKRTLLLIFLGFALLPLSACDNDSSSTSNDLPPVSSETVELTSSLDVSDTAKLSSSLCEPALSSSSEIVETHSTDVGQSSSETVSISSSEQSSFSAQESSSSLVDEFEWNDNRERIVQVIKRFNGDSSEIQKEGRVLVALDDTTNFNEFVDSLGALDLWLIDSLNCKRKNYDVYFVKFKQDIPKTTLAEIIPGFFNSFNVDDTTKIKVSLSEYKKKYLSTDECGVAVECWKDISEEACNEIMESCGCSVDPGDVNWCGGESSMSYESSVTIESVDCLASHRDVLRVDVGCAEAD